MERLSSVNGLVISQKKEWGEIFSGFETKNKYAVLDTSGNELYIALEEKGSSLFLGRKGSKSVVDLVLFP